MHIQEAVYKELDREFREKHDFSKWLDRKLTNLLSMDEYPEDMVDSFVKIHPSSVFVQAIRSYIKQSKGMKKALMDLDDSTIHSRICLMGLLVFIDSKKKAIISPSTQSTSLFTEFSGDTVSYIEWSNKIQYTFQNLLDSGDTCFIRNIGTVYSLVGKNRLFVGDRPVKSQMGKQRGKTKRKGNDQEYDQTSDYDSSEEEEDDDIGGKTKKNTIIRIRDDEISDSDDEKNAGRRSYKTSRSGAPMKLGQASQSSDTGKSSETEKSGQVSRSSDTKTSKDEIHLDESQIMQRALEIYKRYNSEEQDKFRDSLLAVSKQVTAVKPIEAKLKRELKKIAVTAKDIDSQLADTLQFFSSRRECAVGRVTPSFWDLHSIPGYCWQYIGSGSRCIISRDHFSLINESFGNVFFVWRVLQLLYSYRHFSRTMKSKSQQVKISTALARITPVYDNWLEMEDPDMYMESGQCFSYISMKFIKLEDSVEYTFMHEELKSFYHTLLGKLLSDRWSHYLIRRFGIEYLRLHHRYNEWITAIEQSKEMKSVMKNHPALPVVQSSRYPEFSWDTFIPTLVSLGLDHLCHSTD